MFPQRDALIRLLGDDDRETVNLVKAQLADGGAENLAALRDLLQTDDQRVTAHVSDIIQGIESRLAVENFTRFCELFPDEGDIEQACWRLAQAMHPGLDTEPFRLRLDAWGRQFALLISNAISERERVLQLSQFLTQLGFRGNTEDYYNPRNSLLPSVIDTRTGIPITLCLLNILIARRAGMRIEGVNLPGHFIARHGDVLFDPFHRGKILALSDCVQILARQNLTIEAAHLAEADSRAMLTRILANMLMIYEKTDDAVLHERILDWLHALTHRKYHP